MAGKYNQEIERMADEVIKKPQLLKTILKNYDKLVKEKNNMTNLELPYWCYGFCGESEAENE